MHQLDSNPNLPLHLQNSRGETQQMGKLQKGQRPPERPVRENHHLRLHEQLLVLLLHRHRETRAQRRVHRHVHQRVGNAIVHHIRGVFRFERSRNFHALFLVQIQRILLQKKLNTNHTRNSPSFYFVPTIVLRRRKFNLRIQRNDHFVRVRLFVQCYSAVDAFDNNDFDLGGKINRCNQNFFLHARQQHQQSDGD